MPAQPPKQSVDSPRSASYLIRAGCLLALLSAGWFASNLADESFADEYAYITQSYQPDLVYSGHWSDPSWLDVVGYDLVPLPKYFINLAYRAAGLPRPNRRDAVAWYRNTSYQWGTVRELTIARVPSILTGALGCVGLFALGALVAGPATGAVAALLLAVNPLYRLHAHRAMSEAPCEAFHLLSLALGLWAWKTALKRSQHPVIVLSVMLLAGCSVGLSVLAKFNGVLALLSLVAWTVLGMVLSAGDRRKRLILSAGPLGAIAFAAATFVLLNPFMTAHPGGPLPADRQAIAEMGPGERILFLAGHRRQVSQDQQRMFPHNAVHTGLERARVVAVQGFGRFGPLGPPKSDSTVRYDLAQDFGAIVWLPLVAVGLIWSILLGRRQLAAGEPPAAWALALWACLTVATVAAYLPMAWDRYELPVQAPASLLAALPLTATGLAFKRALFRSATRD
jgi:4-amino-4-deoxy-L-arabinose transferase-like glycosyltransferase